jgi:hypothetical protein
MATTGEKPVITLGNIELVTPKERIKRLSMLIWGSSGSGKTTLAATAPGNKLWINFDPDGTDAIAYRDDIQVMDFSNEPHRIVEKFKEDDPLRITQFLVDHKEIETVVFDSLTTFGDKALSHGVVKATGTAKGRNATIEDPGYAGYGNKNTWTRLCIKNLLKATGRANRNIIFIAHEDKPLMTPQGEMISISIMLGSSLNEQVPVDFSEIWNLSDTGKVRRIAVRNCRFRKPVKSRIFITSDATEFEWNYNADTGKGHGIKDWYEAWKSGGGKKIPLPN